MKPRNSFVIPTALPPTLGGAAIGNQQRSKMPPSYAERLSNGKIAAEGALFSS
jgi:hypothetical protein